MSLSLDEQISAVLKLMKSGQWTHAEELASRLRENFPNEARVLHLLAHLAVGQGALHQAHRYLQQAVEISPQNAELWTDLGYCSARLADFDAAQRELQRAAQLDPRLLEPWIHLGDVCLARGDIPAAGEAYCRGIALRPEEPGVYARIGAQTKAPEVLDRLFAECADRLLELDPSLSSVGWFHFALVAQTRGCMDVAIAGYLQTLKLDPNHHTGRNNLATAYRDVGEVEAALKLFAEVAATASASAAVAASNRLYLLHFHAGVEPQTLRGEHETWARGIASNLPAVQQDPTSFSPRWVSTHSRLRIGYVSPNFCQHPVGRFLLRLFANHDPEKFEITAYSSGADEDSITARLKQSVEHWVDCGKMTDHELARKIANDRIDIMVDLAMHMRGHRLGVFAMKPAPVQVTYLAYCSTSGLASIDYRLTDPYLDPPEEKEREGWYVERTMHLPKTYWCYDPGISTPAVNSLPAMARGYVTFAALNNFSKVSSQTLDAWAEILVRTRNSRLLIHCHRGRHRQRVLTRFAEHAVAAERVVFVDHLSLPEYFQLYSLVDLALDTFPYAGGTTTCDAIWMGVPVLTLPGNLAVSRGGVSILNNVGVPELIASTYDQYIEMGVELARNVDRLAKYRAQLRPAMEKSPLMDGPGFARDVGSAYRQMVFAANK